MTHTATPWYQVLRAVHVLVVLGLILALPGCGKQLAMPDFDLPTLDLPQLDLSEARLPTLNLPVPGQALAWAQPVDVGGVTLRVPAPTGYIEVCEANQALRDALQGQRKSLLVLACYRKADAKSNPALHADRRLPDASGATAAGKTAAAPTQSETRRSEANASRSSGSRADSGTLTQERAGLVTLATVAGARPVDSAEFVRYKQTLAARAALIQRAATSYTGNNALAQFENSPAEVLQVLRNAKNWVVHAVVRAGEGGTEHGVSTSVWLHQRLLYLTRFERGTPDWPALGAFGEAWASATIERTLWSRPE